MLQQNLEAHIEVRVHVVPWLVELTQVGGVVGTQETLQSLKLGSVVHRAPVMARMLLMGRTSVVGTASGYHVPCRCRSPGVTELIIVVLVRMPGRRRRGASRLPLRRAGAPARRQRTDHAPPPLRSWEKAASPSCGARRLP